MDAKKLFDTFIIFVKQCVNTCISIAKVIVRIPNISGLPAATGQSCVILGNGPSLTQSLASHPAFFKDHPLVCVNGFALTKEFTELKPTYYVMLDSGFWLHSNEIINTIIENLRTKTTWELFLLIPPQAKRSPALSLLQRQNPNIKIIYFNYTVFKGFPGIAHFFYKRNMAMMQSQNVLAASLFLSINMGFKDIYLFGADHTWHQNLFVNDDNELCVKHIHFYDNVEKITYVPFYKGVHLKEVFRVHEIYGIFEKTFLSYVAIDKYAKFRNSTIYNASAVSFIDAFKRIKL